MNLECNYGFSMYRHCLDILNDVPAFCYSEAPKDISCMFLISKSRYKNTRKFQEMCKEKICCQFWQITRYEKDFRETLYNDVYKIMTHTNCISIRSFGPWQNEFKNLFIEIYILVYIKIIRERTEFSFRHDVFKIFPTGCHGN